MFCEYYETVSCIGADLSYSVTRTSQLMQGLQGTLPSPQKFMSNLTSVFRSFGPLERGLSQCRRGCYRTALHKTKLPVRLLQEYTSSTQTNTWKSACEQGSREKLKSARQNRKSGWGEGLSIWTKKEKREPKSPNCRKSWQKGETSWSETFGVWEHWGRAQNEEKNGTPAESVSGNIHSNWKSLIDFELLKKGKDFVYIYLRKFCHRQRTRILPDKHMYSCQLYCCKPRFGDTGVSRPYIHPHLCRCQISDSSILCKKVHQTMPTLERLQN